VDAVAAVPVVLVMDPLFGLEALRDVRRGRRERRRR
jgi:hypothetical protein